MDWVISIFTDAKITANTYQFFIWVGLVLLVLFIYIYETIQDKEEIDFEDCLGLVFVSSCIIAAIVYFWMFMIPMISAFLFIIGVVYFFEKIAKALVLRNAAKNEIKEND